MRVPKLPSLGIRLPRTPDMSGVTPGSITSLLDAALGAIFWALTLATAAVLLAFIFTTFVPLGPMGLTVTAGDEGTTVPVPRAYILFALGAIFAYLGGFALVLRQQRAMIHTLGVGDPFHPRNVSRLKQIGWTLAIVTGGSWIGQNAVSHLVRGALEPPGLFDLVTPTFAVLIVFVLAGVFREGARLRRESELTI